MYMYVCMAEVLFACSYIRLCVLICRNWSKRIKVAKENPEERTKVVEACSPSETDKNIIRHEVRYKHTAVLINNISLHSYVSMRIVDNFQP